MLYIKYVLIDQYVCNTLLKMAVKMVKFTYLRTAL